MVALGWCLWLCFFKVALKVVAVVVCLCCLAGVSVICVFSLWQFDIYMFGLDIDLPNPLQFLGGNSRENTLKQTTTTMCTPFKPKPHRPLPGSSQAALVPSLIDPSNHQQLVEDEMNSPNSAGDLNHQPLS